MLYERNDDHFFPQKLLHSNYVLVHTQNFSHSNTWALVYLHFHFLCKCHNNHKWLNHRLYIFLPTNTADGSYWWLKKKHEDGSKLVSAAAQKEICFDKDEAVLLCASKFQIVSLKFKGKVFHKWLKHRLCIFFPTNIVDGSYWRIKKKINLF